MVETWRGIYPITAFAHDALRHKLQSEGEAALSVPENTLLVACEFWAAVNRGAIGERLESDAVEQLLLATAAFTQLGALQVAAKLRSAVAQLSRGPAPIPSAEVAVWLEEEVVRTDDVVDDLIARFAIDHVDMDTTQR